VALELNLKGTADKCCLQLLEVCTHHAHASSCAGAASSTSGADCGIHAHARVHGASRSRTDADPRCVCWLVEAPATPERPQCRWSAWDKGCMDLWTPPIARARALRLRVPSSGGALIGNAARRRCGCAGQGTRVVLEQPSPKYRQQCETVCLSREECEIGKRVRFPTVSSGAEGGKDCPSAIR
jgi:hypothetical protein